MKLKKEIKRFFTLKHKANNGFTLVELIVVIAILGVLGGVAVPVYSGYVEKANRSADDQLLATINKAYAVACLKNGDDMTKLTSAKMEITDESVVNLGTVYPYGPTFREYYLGNEASEFKYYDYLRFDNVLDLFVGDSVAAIADGLKKAWGISSYDDEDGTIMGELLGAFDMIGYYFSGNDPLWPDGFSLDGLLANAPAAVREAFGFGTFDLTDEEILEKYVDGYAAMPEAEKTAWKNEHADELNTIKGNAYVMRFAEDAAGRDAATITNDVKSLMSAMQTGVTERQIIDYYNQLNPDNPTDNINTAREGLELMGGTIPAELIVSVGTSGIKNTSGVSTLGSMYALAAGFYNSEYAPAGSHGDFQEFSTVVEAMSNPNFRTYLNGSGAEGEVTQAQKDIDAYLSFMKYISTQDVSTNSANAFAGQLGNIMTALGK